MTNPQPQPDSPPPDVAQLQARIAELEAERVRFQLALYESRDRLDIARRAAAAWKRAAKLYERIAQSVSTPWEVEASRRSFRDARHGRPVLTNEEYQRQWWDALDAAEERKP